MGPLQKTKQQNSIARRDIYNIIIVLLHRYGFTYVQLYRVVVCGLRNKSRFTLIDYFVYFFLLRL